MTRNSKQNVSTLKKYYLKKKNLHSHLTYLAFATRID
jgi:hypothetical protein